jgi:hypothetical protein
MQPMMIAHTTWMSLESAKDDDCPEYMFSDTHARLNCFGSNLTDLENSSIVMIAFDFEICRYFFSYQSS